MATDNPRPRQPSISSLYVTMTIARAKLIWAIVGIISVDQNTADRRRALRTATRVSSDADTSVMPR